MYTTQVSAWDASASVLLWSAYAPRLPASATACTAARASAVAETISWRASLDGADCGGEVWALKAGMSGMHGRTSAG